MSDWEPLADCLAGRADLVYENTFFHQAPFIDICKVPRYMYGRADVVICSDVIEHVPAPVEAAISGLADLLSPEGFLILSVPYDFRDATTEHYADLSDVTVCTVGTSFVVVGRSVVTGDLEVRPEPVFHGGPGTTLEMRFMSWDHLLTLTRAAGLELVTVVPEVQESGLIWLHDFGRTALFRRMP